MKAILCMKYGAPEVLKMAQVPDPVPKENEIRIKVHTAPVTSGDVRVRSFNCPLLYWLPMRMFLGFTKPRKPILGVELAGEVDEVGRNVTKFNPGDQVVAMTGMRFGAHAEYCCLPENGLISIKPRNVSFENSAAVLFGGTTTLHFFRKGNVKQGHKVLIYGASGAVGTSAVQLAKHLGAEVTGVCSTSNMELVQSLGADHVIDYTKQDFSQRTGHYDIVFDAVGKISKRAAKRVLAPTGKFLTVDGQGIAIERLDDMQLLLNLLSNGEIRAVIDRVYTLEQVPEAHCYVEQGHKKGNVVIRVV
jgi:NADPH:quinone reductase-like Zn-dependent oxidoreductase